MEGTIWLVGMMGAGKTRIGRMLAERLECPFVDADAEIEREAARSIEEIFRAEGESGFRKREREVVERLAGRGCVVALGGGAFAQPPLAQLALRTGRVVYLRTRPQTLASRVGQGEGRPLLAGLDAKRREERLRSLLRQREPFYARAPLVVDTDEADASAVVERVQAALGGGR